MQIIGLSGAHRCGKSTLGKEIGSRENFRFYPFETIKAAKANTVGVLSLQERITAQKNILNEFKATIMPFRNWDLETTLVIDRTPLDFAAYMLCEVAMQSDAQYSDEVINYVKDCINTSNRIFDRIFLLSPLSSYQEAVGKPKKNDAFVMHFDTVITGLAHNRNLSIPVKHIHEEDLKERVLSVLLDLYKD